MKTTLTTLLALTMAIPAFAKLVQREITPQNAEDSGWNITIERKVPIVTFTIYWSLNVKDGNLPTGTTAYLSVNDGQKLVCSSALALQKYEGQTCFRFSVAERFVPNSQFRISVMDLPHASGDFYIVDLGKFTGLEQNPKSVPEKQLSSFLVSAKAGGDYHDLAPKGRALLKPGLFIIDYKTKLKDFSSEAFPEKGQVRYTIMSFKGTASAGGINLFLEADTGKIVSFLPFEGSFQ